MHFHGERQTQGVMHTRQGILVLSLAYTRPTSFTFKLGYGDACIEALQVCIYFLEASDEYFPSSANC